MVETFGLPLVAAAALPGSREAVEKFGRGVRAGSSVLLLSCTRSPVLRVSVSPIAVVHLEGVGTS